MYNLKVFAITGLVSLMLSSTCLSPVILADKSNTVLSDIGFDKGPSYKPVVSMKKVTFVNFDEESYLDDYAYLAAVPTAVFDDGGRLFSNPLLFYQDGYPVKEDKERSLNARQGLDYFMEDWMSCCNGQLDQMTLINVPKNKLDRSWETREYTTIEYDNPYDIASELALNEWSYSDDVVVAVIDESFEKPVNVTKNSLEGKIYHEIKTDTLKIKRSKGPSPEFAFFEVDENYKFVSVDVYYPSISILRDNAIYMALMGPGGITFPSVDQDVQLYCDYGEFGWLEVDATSEMTIQKGPHEIVSSYVYAPGRWKVGVTNMPTENVEINGGLIEALIQMLKPVTEYYADVTMYPGTSITVPDIPPFGCENAKFKLTWDNPDIQLGFSVIGALGEEIVSVVNESRSYQEVHIDWLGECLTGEHYSIAVFSLTDVQSSVDFTIEYSWQQNTSKKQRDCLTSATEGAVLASMLNAPLLYVSTDNFPEGTKNTLHTLGVENIHLVNLGGHISSNTKKKLKEIAAVKEFTECEEIYDDIREITGRNDVIFSTIDPWTSWYLNPTVDKSNTMPLAGEHEGALYIGPAAYLAAHHGSPVLIVDNHPELTSSLTWHNDYWKKNPDGIVKPSVACMSLTGERIYEFLDKLGFDKEGKESIVTIAGQFDIGMPWSRLFVGKANSGRFLGTPVDTTYWISRNVFYPMLVFENPALHGNVKLINGSKSIRVQSNILRPFKRFWARLSPSTPGLSNLKIIKPSQEEEFTYPVLHTYAVYSHRFNERGSKFWGEKYVLADGDIPGETVSFNPIDQGVREKYEGVSGGYLPDHMESEITPFYCAKAGYSNVFSSNFTSIMENLNRGVISWYEIVHGGQNLGGNLDLWDACALQTSMEETFGLSPSIAKIIQNFVAGPLGLYPLNDPNPWRGYEQLWGSTEEPDSASVNTEVGLILGILGAVQPHGILNGGIIKTGLDFIPANLGWSFIPGVRENYFDGIVMGVGFSAAFTRCYFAYGAIQVDDALENIHSCSINAGSCLIGGKYMTLTFIRHGAVFVEADPWPTSYWGATHFQSFPRELAIGKTIGEAYNEGMEKVGITYIAEKGESHNWWWDTAENVILYGDPDLRIWVPSTEYSDENHWEQDEVQPLRYDEELNVDGHMPFGATGHPNEKQPMTFLEEYILIISIIAIALLVIAIVCISRIKRKNNDR